MPRGARKKLTVKQSLFWKEYLVDLNGPSAILRAGYKTKYPGKMAFQLLENTRIQEELQKALKEREKKIDIEIDKNDIIKELQFIAFSDYTDFLKLYPGENGKPHISIADMNNMPKEKLKTISEISLGKGGLRIKLHDKVKALETLCKLKGLFTEKVKITGEVEVKYPLNLSKLTNEELKDYERLVRKSRDIQ
jgi:phage terminase small subunit